MLHIGLLSLLQLLLCLHANATRGPTFIKEPPDEVNFSNATGAWIDCQAQGSPIPKITWARSDGSGTTDDVQDLRIIYPNGTLIFLPFRAENYRQDIHASVYKCLATNPLGVAVSREVKIRAVVKQNYEANVYDEFVIRKNTAVMKCHIPSFVQDYVIVTSWIREDNKGTSSVINNGGRYSVFPSGALHIREVGKEDSFRYKCKTKHVLTQETKVSSSGKLIVTDPQSSVASRITHFLPNIEIEQGKNVELPCAAQGYPNPHYNWWRLKNGIRENVRKGGRFEMRSGSLFIHGVQIDDEATYICEVNNSVSTEKAETVLMVTAPLSAFVQPSFQQIDVGRSANLTCSVSGYPITSIEWLKDGNSILSNAGGHIHFITPEVLQIDSVQREHRGIYQCFVKNRVAAAQSVAELKLGDAIPIFHETFPEKVYQRGMTVSLKCVVYGNPPPQVSWTLDDRPLPKVARYHVQEFVNMHGDVISFVNISSVSTEDGGDYACYGKNRVGRAEYTARVDVHGPPYIRAMPNITAITGDSMNLKCRVSGYPIHMITWERDGIQLPINHRQKVFPNGTLEVENLERPMDEGPYTCIAKNHHGESGRRMIYVALKSAPTITPFSFPHNLREGMRAGITCFITDGDLPIIIQWLKDSGPIASHMDVTTNTLNEYTSTLTINSINPRNNGNYTCVATNSAASTNYTAQLLVNVPPRWSIEPRDSNVTLDMKAIIDCQADGFPYPNITWKKRMGNGLGDYRTIHYYMDDANSIARNGSLIIEKTQEGSEGYYLCQANNGVGSGLSKLAFLKVHIPARFETKQRHETARKGMSTKLVCEAKGDSPLIMTWKKNDSIIDQHQDPRITIKEMITATKKKSEFIIHKTDRSDHAEFKCQARNNYGSDIMSITLSILEKPETPRKVSVSEATSRSVQLSWTVPFDGNSQITKYRYQYKVNRDPWVRNDQTGTVNGTMTSAIVSDLFPASKYSFRIAAENEVGISNFSDIATITTLEEVPGGPPLSIRMEPITSQALRLFWKPPRQDLWNGEILGYHIGYRLLDSMETTETYIFSTKDSRVTDNEMTLNNLKKYSKYGVVIEAYNRMGAGPRSQEVVAITLEDTPSHPPLDIRCTTVSSTVIKVDWEPPPQQYVHGILQGYKVYYGRTEFLEETREPKTSPSSTVHLEGLHPFSNYSIRALAFTKVGDGIRSKAVHCRTEEDVPGPPEDIKALVMSSDAILITWRPPEHPNGVITKYTIYRRGGHMDVGDLSLPPSEFVHEARSLKEDYQYEFWVTASTIVGEGKRSRKVMLSPQSTVPAKIGSFPEKIVVYRKADVKLSCRAVGIPTPERYWKKLGEKLHESSRIRITSDGSLTITDTRSTDSGNYTCRVENIYAADDINHELIVKEPPSAPMVKVVDTTKTSLKIAWKVEDDGGSHIKGYKLNYKREEGNWQEVVLENENTSYLLENLMCGSRYHIYVTAENKAGTSEMSKIEVTNTKGFPPIIPSEEQLLQANRTSIMVYLDAWVDGGCHIQHFTLECTPKGNTEWMLIANNVKPSQRNYVIRDLLPNTTYAVRISVISESGMTRVDYEATTTDDLKGGYASDVTVEGRLKYLPFYFNLNIIIPLVVTLIVVIVITATVCDFMKRRQHSTYKRSGYLSRNNVLPPLKQSGMENSDKKGEGGGGIKGEAPSSPQRGCGGGGGGGPGGHRSHPSGAQDDVSPYATYQLPECVSINDDENGITMHTFGQLGTPTAANPLGQGQTSISPNKKGLYSRVRKARSSGISDRQRYPNLPVETHSPFDEHRGFHQEKHKGPPPREILRMHAPFIESAVAVAPSAPPAEYETANMDTESPPESNSCTLKFESSIRTKPFHRVPDLLYHRPDSSSSNEISSPDTDRDISIEQRHRSKQNKRNSRKKAAWTDRGSSPDSLPDETPPHYTINKALGPPAGFTDTSLRDGTNVSENNNPGCGSGTDENTQSNERITKNIDSVRLAAAEEELIALLKRGTASTSSASVTHFRSSKDDFTVRV